MGGKAEEIKEGIKQLISEAVEEAVAEAAGPKSPGQIEEAGELTARKVHWTFHDAEKLYPPVTFTPEETIPVTFNGLTVQLMADQPITVPSCFKGIYDEHRRLVRQSAKPFWTPGGVVSVTPGAGALGPEQFTEQK